MKPSIGVIGPNNCDPDERRLGFDVGAGIANAGAVLVCGGLGGMMEAAAEGAKSKGGTTIGILPGQSPEDANSFIDIPVPTGLDVVRNFLVIRASSSVIAVRGGYGTLTEIAIALRLGIPVIGLRTWTVSRDGLVDPGILTAETPDEAVSKALDAMKNRRGN